MDFKLCEFESTQNHDSTIYNLVYLQARLDKP